MNDIIETKMKKTELDKEYIKSLLQEIVNKHQPDLKRRRIIERDKEYVTNCFICGDSTKPNGHNNPRGHLYMSNLRWIVITILNVLVHSQNS